MTRRRYLHTHDPDVDNAEYAEIYDAWHDTQPTLADLDPHPPAPVPPHDYDTECPCLVCAMRGAYE